MENMKKVFENEAAANGLGRFSRLPNDLFVSILDRIHDLKCLFQCTLVSKDFANSTYRVKSITLQLPASGASTDICHLFREKLMVELNKPRVSSPPSPNTEELKFTKFLQKFTELEFASFESSCPVTPCISPSLKWKAKLGGNCGLAIEVLVSLLPSTMCLESEVASEVESGEEDGEEEDSDEGEENENEEDEEEDNDEGEDSGDDEGEDSGGEEVDDDGDEEDEEEVQEYPKHLANGCLLSSIMSFAEWFDIMFPLIKHHQTLKSVICTDSGKHGKIVLNAEQIVEWRKGLVSGELSHIVIPKTIFMGRVPSSDLPLPGYRIKEASYVFLSFCPIPSTYRSIFEGWEYDEEDKVIADIMDRIPAMNRGCKLFVTRPY